MAQVPALLIRLVSRGATIVDPISDQTVPYIFTHVFYRFGNKLKTSREPYAAFCHCCIRLA